MTDGDDGAGRPSGLSRRRLLAGIGGVGAVGMASGLGTGAYLSDRETFADNVFGAGEVELALTVDGEPTNGTVSLAVSGIDRGHSGREEFEVSVHTNPVRVWFATDCPDAGDTLARALEVDIAVDRESVTDGYRPLADVERDLVAGERLVEGCLAPDDRVPVEVLWRLPADAPDEAAGQAADLTFKLYAEQCRHVAETGAENSNPFAAYACEEVKCVPCADDNGVKIGSLTLRYLGDEPANVTVAAVGSGSGGRGNGGTAVLDDEVGPNETFTVDGADVPANDPDWIGPMLFLDDGSGNNGSGNNGSGNNGSGGVEIHTSCSVSLGLGDVYGRFEVVAATTTDGEPLCGSEEN